MNASASLLAAGTTALSATDGLSIGVTVVGALVGVIGLYLSWSSGRAERAAARLQQLITIEADARTRGPLRTGDLRDVGKHQAFLTELDEEVRLHQRIAFDTTRRVGSAVSTGAVLGWALYGVFLVWMGAHFPGHPETTWVVFGVFAAAGLACLIRAAVITGRRTRIWQARRDTGINDLYSRKTVTLIWNRVRGREANAASVSGMTAATEE